MGNAFSSTKKVGEVHVHFNRKKLRVVFGPEDYNADKKVQLQQFRTKLAKSLGVPATSLVLYKLKPQKKMANMGSTLEDYGVKNGDDIMAVQIEEKPTAVAPISASHQIDHIVEEVNSTLGERIDNFVSGPPSDPEARDQENRVLCETLLAKTIALDNVEVENQEERGKRKDAISKMQKYMRSIDEAMQASSKAEDSPATEPKEVNETAASESAKDTAEGGDVKVSENIPQTENPLESNEQTEAVPSNTSEEPAPAVDNKKAPLEPAAVAAETEPASADAPASEVVESKTTPEVPTPEVPASEVPTPEVSTPEVPADAAATGAAATEETPVKPATETAASSQGQSQSASKKKKNNKKKKRR